MLIMMEFRAFASKGLSTNIEPNISSRNVHPREPVAATPIVLRRDAAGCDGMQIIFANAGTWNRRDALEDKIDDDEASKRKIKYLLGSRPPGNQSRYYSVVFAFQRRKHEKMTPMFIRGYNSGCSSEVYFRGRASRRARARLWHKESISRK